MADSGPVHWFGDGGDTIVIGVQSISAIIEMFVLTVEQNAFVLQEDYEAYPVALRDLKLGRFDNLNADGTVNPDLQLAVLNAVDGAIAPAVTIFNIGSSGSGYTLTAVSSATTNLLVTGKLAVGDLQGRSLRLGTPDKITINNHSSPSTMVGMPPMHLDWAIPSCNDPNFPKNCTTIQQVGVIAQPASNYAQLNTDVKGSSQSSSQKTTSFTLAAKETVDAKVSYGIPDVAEASLEVKDTAKETYGNTVATAENSYSSFAFDASVRTGFADHIWFDNYRFNLWTYPIIGQMVCPQSIPNCTNAQKVPMHVQFSGPDQISTYEIDGNVVEWYQPVWEPGNILSYPWTEDQLLAVLPRSVINNKSDVWAADSSGSNASVTWAQGGGQSTSQSNTNSYSNDASVTASGEASIEGFTVEGSVGIDITVSGSTQTLNTSSNTHGSSTGFTVAKSEQGVTDYIFAAQTYILGQVPPTGTLQTLPTTATVQTSGPLRLAYWVNPFDSVVGGDWWPATYTLPDVALNHPQRWTWTNTPQPNRMTFNHILTSTSAYDQEFYFMRGLYVTSVGAPNGSQLTTAPLTETVLLQARVYNYSHVDMDAPTLAHKAARVKVRFYGQLFRSDTGEYPLGASFLIGESELAPIPGFDSATTAADIPNWSLAVQPFNPASFAQTQNGDVYVRFWVVVWMEDVAGHLVAEMPGHGLSASPSGREYTGMGQVHVEPYSNNVGTFKQVFYVQSPNHSPLALSSGAQGDGGAPSASAAPTLTVEATLTLAPEGTGFGKHQITTIVRDDSANTSLHLAYYDGDPAQGGRLFDWEMIPYLVAGTPFVNRVTYTPQACGTQQVYVVVKAAGTETTQNMSFAGAPCQVLLPWVEKK